MIRTSPTTTECPYWCPAPLGVRDELVTSEPDRFFAPTPSASGVFGDWIGVYLDTSGELAVDWDEIAAIIEGAYRLRAPRTLVARLDLHTPRAEQVGAGRLPGDDRR